MMKNRMLRVNRGMRWEIEEIFYFIIVKLLVLPLIDWEAGIGRWIKRSAQQVLSKDEKYVFGMHCLSGFSVERIADLKGISSEEVEAVLDTCAQKVSGRMYILPRSLIRLLMKIKNFYIGI